MDLKPWECQVCRTSYRNPDRRPRTLPCGHTFCTPCLQNLAVAHNHTEHILLRCPTCRASDTLTSTITQLPTNYDLEAVAQAMTNKAGAATSDDPLVTQTGTKDVDHGDVTDAAYTNHVLEAVVQTMTNKAEGSTTSEKNSDEHKSKTDSRCTEILEDADDTCKNQCDKTSTLEKDTIDAVKSVSAALRKERTPGLSKRLRASLKEQQQRLQDSITACQEVHKQLNNYRSSLAAWTQQHKDLIQDLTNLQQQNQEALQQLQNEDERVVVMQEEGQEDMNQLRAMVATLEAVTTPQEAFVATNDADCHAEDAEEWREQACQQFPEPGPVQHAAQIRSVTAAALRNIQSEPMVPVQLDPDLEITQKVRIITDSVTSTQTAKVPPRINEPKKSTTKTPLLPAPTPTSGPTTQHKTAASAPGTHSTSTASMNMPDQKINAVVSALFLQPDLTEGSTTQPNTALHNTASSDTQPSAPGTHSASTASTDTTEHKTSTTKTPSHQAPKLDSSSGTKSSSSQGSKSVSTDDLLVDTKIGARSVTVEELREMSDRMKRLLQSGRVYAVRMIGARVLSSRLSLKNERVYLHCLQDQTPPPHDALMLKVGEGVGDVAGSSLAFLELSWAGKRRGTVHIRLRSNTSLAKQFNLLCTGQMTHSYLNTNFLSVGSKGQAGEYIIGGDYECNDGTGGAHLLPTFTGKYHKSDRAGAVLGWYTLGGGKGAQFAILTRDGMRGDGKKYINVFGEVESGMQALRLAAQYSNIKEVEIVDCGVVLNA